MIHTDSAPWAAMGLISVRIMNYYYYFIIDVIIIIIINHFYH